MFLPEVEAKLHEHGIQSVVIFGIEVRLKSLSLSHLLILVTRVTYVCCKQRLNYWIKAMSCMPLRMPSPAATRRRYPLPLLVLGKSYNIRYGQVFRSMIRQAGVIVTTSESLAFQMMGKSRVFSYSFGTNIQCRRCKFHKLQRVFGLS